jgi:hypothetical protein
MTRAAHFRGRSAAWRDAPPCPRDVRCRGAAPAGGAPRPGARLGHAGRLRPCSPVIHSACGCGLATRNPVFLGAHWPGSAIVNGCRGGRCADDAGTRFPVACGRSTPRISRTNSRVQQIITSNLRLNSVLRTWHSVTPHSLLDSSTRACDNSIRHVLGDFITFSTEYR